LKSCVSASNDLHGPLPDTWQYISDLLVLGSPHTEHSTTDLVSHMQNRRE